MLWEALDADCMDVAVKLHGAAVRLLLTRHGGYESATEGDAFILAFSAAHDALSFSLDLQAELLQLAWPQQLLAQPLCAEVYMTQWWVCCLHLQVPQEYRTDQSLFACPAMTNGLDCMGGVVPILRSLQFI